MNLREKLLSSSRLVKQFIAAIIDLFTIFFAILVSIYLSGPDEFLIEPNKFIGILWIPFFSVLIFYFFGVYQSVLRFIGLAFFYRLLLAVAIVFISCLIIRLLLLDVLSSPTGFIGASKFYVTDWLLPLLLSIVLIFTSRIFANYFFSQEKHEKKVIIYGAGSAGMQLARALSVSKEMKPIAFVDNNTTLHDTYIGGLRVLNPKKLQRLASRGKVDEVLIAMPSASKLTLRGLLREIEDFSVKVRILPGLAELAQGKISISELKEVDISDLLGRLEVEAKKHLIDRNIEDKVVLITGAGGSIGSEISRQVAKNKPKKIILLDVSEYALFSIKNELEESLVEVNIHAVLASVTNKKRMIEVCKSFNVQTVYHAAAYKHVSLVEENPFEAVSNNILGTKVCVESAIETEVETFVLISTDKAVRPTNIMGATKRFSELILQSIASESKTKMTMVRFGNVIGSSGSAVPLFQRQIKEGGPVTVTHPDIVRYFMSIPEAAELVIQAGAMGEGGDVFVLDMGEPVKIVELAKRLINLSGMDLIDEKNPEGDIEIIFTGLRPGEKLYEELLIGGNVSPTEHKKILKAQEESLSSNELENYLKLLHEAEQQSDVVALQNTLKEAIDGYNPEKEIVDDLYLERNN